MKKLKFEQGITLITLIITIIILLILALVTFNAVNKDNGDVIQHAQNEKTQFTIMQEEEAIKVALLEWNLIKVGNFKEIIKNSLKSQNFDVTINGEVDGPLKVIFKKTGNSYDVTKDSENNNVQSVWAKRGLTSPNVKFGQTYFNIVNLGGETVGISATVFEDGSTGFIKSDYKTTKSNYSSSYIDSAIGMGLAEIGTDYISFLWDEVNNITIKAKFNSDDTITL